MRLRLLKEMKDRKNEQDEKKILEEQYQQSQKMESIGRLAGGISHDLNNLLTPIIGYSELLKLSMDDSDRNQEFVDGIYNAGNKARQLVKQLMMFSRKQHVNLVPADLNKIVTDFLRLLRSTLRENIVIETELTDKHSLIKANSGQVEQILMNLALNAQDAMPGGGLLTLKTDIMYLDNTFSRHYNEVVPGNYMMLSVRDNGTGMDEATRRHIFEPFFTTKGEKGFGLGLSTVFGIIKNHNGYLWVYSEEGSGTVFKMFFPLSEEPLYEDEGLDINTFDGNDSGTVCVVEDNDQVRILVEYLLTDQGYEVFSADNPDRALSYFKTHKEKIDLLLTDVILSESNGIELAEKIKKIHPETKVIFMSGYTDELLPEDTDLEADFIQKPFSRDVLLGMVRNKIG